MHPLKNKLIFCAAMLLASAPVSAQQIDSDIYLLSFNVIKGKYVFEAPYNFTNRPGYDNQPSFSADGMRILFASYNKDTIQSDIFEYNLEDSSTTQITKTPESEFSPMFIQKEEKISCIVLETNKAQHFFTMMRDGSDAYQSLGSTDSAAYYDWITDSTLAMVVLDKNMMLNIYDLPSEQFTQLAKNVGRCVKRIPGTDEVSYIDKTDTAKYVMLKFGVSSGEIGNVTEMPRGIEDYAWTADGKLICGNKGKLMMFDPAVPDNGWMEVADFSKSVGEFYRISVSPKGNRWAVVAFKGKKP